MEIFLLLCEHLSSTECLTEPGCRTRVLRPLLDYFAGWQHWHLVSLPSQMAQQGTGTHCVLLKQRKMDDSKLSKSYQAVLRLRHFSMGCMSYDSYHVKKKKKTDKNWLYCYSMTVMLVGYCKLRHACFFVCDLSV